MLCGLKKECSKFRKEKMEKEKKKLNVTKSVRRDEKLSYNQRWSVTK